MKSIEYQWVGISNALPGHKAEALVAARKSVALLSPSNDALQGPPRQEYPAYVEAWVGERGAAIRLLRHLLPIPHANPLTVPMLRADPGLDSLRGDSRFQALLKEKPAVTSSATSGE